MDAATSPASSIDRGRAGASIPKSRMRTVIPEIGLTVVG